MVIEQLGNPIHIRREGIPPGYDLMFGIQVENNSARQRFKHRAVGYRDGKQTWYSHKSSRCSFKLEIVME